MAHAAASEEGNGGVLGAFGDREGDRGREGEVLLGFVGAEV